MATTTHDQYETCVCTHRMGVHHDHGSRDPQQPHPCRACDCENFMTQAEMDALNAPIATTKGHA